MNPFKCSICGKYISYRELEEGNIEQKYTPDSEFTIEEFEYWHEKCKSAEVYNK